MKYFFEFKEFLLLFLPILFLFSFNSIGQSITNKSSHATYPSNIPVQSIIDQKNNDTLSWYWNRAEVIAYAKSVSHDSSYYSAPISGLGVFAAGTSYTVTTTKVKSNSVVQVGWYGTSSIHSATATAIYVPTSGISDAVQFKISASQSQSDSFWYFIWNHY